MHRYIIFVTLFFTTVCLSPLYSTNVSTVKEQKKREKAVLHYMSNIASFDNDSPYEERAMVAGLSDEYYFLYCVAKALELNADVADIRLPLQHYYRNKELLSDVDELSRMLARAEHPHKTTLVRLLEPQVRGIDPYITLKPASKHRKVSDDIGTRKYSDPQSVAFDFESSDRSNESVFVSNFVSLLIELTERIEESNKITKPSRSSIRMKKNFKLAPESSFPILAKDDILDQGPSSSSQHQGNKAIKKNINCNIF